MKSQDFEKRLKQSLQKSPIIIEEEHFKNMGLLVREEVSRKQNRKRISFICFLRIQIKFIGWKIWSMQGICLAILNAALFHFYEYMQNPRYITKLLFCTSVLVFMTALPFLYRAVHYQMQEIEAGTRFSCVKLLMAKLIVIGVGDVFMLGGVFLTVLIKTSLQAGSAVLYLCFPFLLVSGSGLFMLGHFTPKRFLIGSVGVCLFLVLLFIRIPVRFSFLFGQSFSAGWLVICSLLVVFCERQFHYILYDAPYAEMQII